jgi:hypothetical protein
MTNSENRDKEKNQIWRKSISLFLQLFRADLRDLQKQEAQITISKIMTQ